MFERDSGATAARILTLEPRILYIYTPYRRQDELPLFDTALPDLNLVELFRTNRYVGADRVSDADQVSIGATSRLVDAKDGTQFLAATLGQIYYFKKPQVELPEHCRASCRPRRAAAPIWSRSWRSRPTSIGAQISTSSGTRGTFEGERTEASLQYHPAPDEVANFTYRQQREPTGSCPILTGEDAPSCDRLRQVETSATWPIGAKWNLYGRLVYSLLDNQLARPLRGVRIQRLLLAGALGRPALPLHPHRPAGHGRLCTAGTRRSCQCRICGGCSVDGGHPGLSSLPQVTH